MSDLGGARQDIPRHCRDFELLFASVKTYLDTARHKLSCINLTHAVAVAIATEVIPAKALRQPC